MSCKMTLPGLRSAFLDIYNKGARLSGGGEISESA